MDEVNVRRDDEDVVDDDYEKKQMSFGSMVPLVVLTAVDDASSLFELRYEALLLFDSLRTEPKRGPTDSPAVKVEGCALPLKGTPPPMPGP